MAADPGPTPPGGTPPGGTPLRILYSLAHPSDRLARERAGHIVRAVHLLAALERAGHRVTRVESAATPGAAAGARAYRSVVRPVLGAVAGTALRDAGRVAGNRRFAQRLLGVARSHPFDVVLETHVGFSRAGARVATAAGLPLVVDDVSPAAEDEDVYDVRLRRVARRARRFTLDRATLVTVVSPALLDQLIGFDGIDPGRVVLLPNGVDAGTLQPQPGARERRARLGSGEDVVVTYAGSFQSFHRVDLLLDALAACRHRGLIRALLVGDGTERAACERRAHDLGLAPRVTFAGRVPSADVAGFLQASDACVLPATGAYMSPMKLYEYLAAGRPVVVPDVVAVRDVVEEHRVGSWFRPGDVAGLAAALDAVAGAVPADRAAMGEAARALAGRHTWDARAAALVAALRLTPPLPGRSRGGPAGARAPRPAPRR